MTAPALFENYVATGETYLDLPDPVQPYYAITKEGSYLHRATALGNVLIPAKPKKLGSIGAGYDKGVFHWNAPTIPAEIISQAHDFFKRVYEKHHTEAEVLITYHTEEKRYRLFVPFQRVSHTGVKSIFEPGHIQKGWLVVGTLHSHCDFSAFHSGTDSADASDMDGVHFTIGHVTREVPEIVAMVAMGGKEFHYAKPEDIADIQFGKSTAPEWWDNFVFPGKTPTDKPKGFKTISEEDWNEFKGLHVGVTRKVTPSTSQTGYTPYSGHWSDNDWDGWESDYRNHSYYGSYGQGRNVIPFTPTRESQEWNKKHSRERAYDKPTKKRKMIVWRMDTTSNEMRLWDLDLAKWVGSNPGDEDRILDSAIDELLESNLISEKDFEIMDDEEPTRKNISMFILRKMSHLADIAETLGVTAEIHLKEPEAPKQLPGQMTVEEALLPEE